MLSGRIAAVVVVLLLLVVPAAAHAQFIIIQQPDYVLNTWFRVGLTSNGVVTAGVAVERLPVTVGIDVAPWSKFARFRAFAGLKVAGVIVPCTGVGGISGAAAYAFGPGQPGHFGVQLGVYGEHRPIAYGSENVSFPRTEWGGSYRFSWFPDIETLHDVNVNWGLLWAPNGRCQGV